MQPRPERPLNIIHVFRAPVGGLFRHVHDVVRGQVEAGHNIGIICDAMTGGERGNRLLDELAPLLTLGIHRLPMHRNPHWSDGPALNLVRRITAEKAVDVLHGHGAKGGFYARFAGVFTPNSGPIRCYTPHGGSLNYYPGSLRHRIFMGVERLLERGTDLFLFESQFIQERYHAYVCVSKRPTRIALNGLYDPEFTAVTPLPDATDLLYVGEFREAKGIVTLVDALTILAKKGLRPTVTMVGSGPSEGVVHAQAEHNDIARQIVWRGVTPAAEAFRLGRIMVVPSWFESLPYIVLEAVAGQLPMISTDVGGIPEILPPDYRYLIKPRDSKVLAACLEDALGRPFADLRADAKALSEHIQGHFRVNLMVETILGGYRDALMKRRGRPIS